MNYNKVPKFIIDLVNEYEYKYSDKKCSESFLFNFVNSFFESLGWDVYNKNNEEFKEVLIEEPIQSYGKRPIRLDYVFSINGKNLFFAEIKNPQHSKSWINQLYHLGDMVEMPFAILTDFENLLICDMKSRIILKHYVYTEYVDKWDEIFNILSKKSIINGKSIFTFNELKNKMFSNTSNYYNNMLNKSLVYFADFNDIEEAKNHINTIKSKNKEKYGELDDLEEIVRVFYQDLNLLISKNIHLESNKSIENALLCFSFLKLLDENLICGNPLEFIYNSEENLESLIYNNFNIDDKIETSKNLAKSLLDYINSFNDNISNIFKIYDFKGIINSLIKNEKFLEFIIKFDILNFNGVFKSKEDFITFYEIFIKRLYMKIYDIFSDELEKDRSNFSSSFLRKVLFSGFNLKKVNEITIYDPVCGDGSLLLDCKNFINKVNEKCVVNLYGCELNPKLYTLCLFRMVFNNQNPVNFKFNERVDINIIKDYNKKFDFIISDFGALEQAEAGKYSLDLETLNSFINNKLVVTTSFNVIRDSSNFIKSWVDADVLDSIIRVPVSSKFKRDCVLVLNHNKIQERKNKFLLMDEYDKSLDYSQNLIPKKLPNKILKRYNKFEDYNNGKIVSVDDVGNIFSFQHLISFNEEDKLNEDIDLEYLVNLVDLNEGKFEDLKSNDLLINPYRNSINDKVIYYPQNCPDISYFIGCNINSNDILSDYLYYYLNSNKGLRDINYFINSDYDFQKEDFYYLPIPVPKIEAQKKIIETAKKMEMFFKDMESWKNDYLNNILNYENIEKSYNQFTCSMEFGENGEISKFCKNWRIVYHGLLWPLAYTYLKATKGSKSPELKKKNSLVLFEFLAAFNSIILISGIENSDIENNVYQDIKKFLWKPHPKNQKSWHRMTFGSWTTLHGRLTKIYKSDKFLTSINKEFFDKLSSNQNYKLFNKLRENERNSDAHSGLEDDIDIKIKLSELEIYLNNDVFNILNIYSGLKLYYVTENNMGEAINKTKSKLIVMSLNGPCNTPNWADFVVSETLDACTLYLYDSLNGNFMKINSDLMKFKLDEETKQYRIYIYDSVDMQKRIIKYKCYDQKGKYLEIPLNRDEDELLSVSNEFKKEVLKLNN